jgi:transposase
MSDSIPTRYQLRVKQRRRVVQYAEAHGLRGASRHFGLARRTVRVWFRRWKAGGDRGLVPLYRQRRKRRVSDAIVELARVARLEHRWGASRTQVWLERVHKLRVNTKTIHRVFREIGVPLLTKTPKRKPRQLKLFEKDAPGDSIQVDVKVIKLKREKVFQYTALDDCTRYRVLRLYRRLNQYSSLHFLGELQRMLPFAVQKLQCDNGSEFPLAFKQARGRSGRHSSSLHQTAAPATEWQGRTQPSHRR